MRLAWTAGLLLTTASGAFSLGLSIAGQPAFDPRGLRGQQAGPLTQVMTLGSTHLSQIEKKPSGAELAPLIDKLAAFRPEIITHEGLSGEQCDQAKRYNARYPGIYDDYCNDTDAAEKATGLTVPQAMEAVDITLAKWPGQPSASQRRKLASLFLAANDRPSALVQWLRLPAEERKTGDEIDQALFDILQKTAKSPNETFAIGVTLAVRLGLERIYAVDDHTSDSIQGLAGDGFEKAIQDHWAASSKLKNPAMLAYQAASDQALKQNNFLAYYRVLNRPETQLAFIDLDFGGALKLPGPQRFGRQYVAWYETRNLRMVANIRAAFGNRPGARVLNIVGASHKGYYDAYLNMMSDVQIVDAEKVLR